jgi:hypothetical protein
MVSITMVIGTKTPVVSYAAASTEFSDRTVHPYFSRVIVADSSIGAAILSLMVLS